MPEKKKFKYYEDVPGDSTITIWVENDVGKYNVDAQLLSPDYVTQFDQADLIPGRAEEDLEAGEAYLLRFRLAFQASSTAKLRTRIIKPDGVVHSSPKGFDVTGTNGTATSRFVYIHMLDA